MYNNGIQNKIGTRIDHYFITTVLKMSTKEKK